MYVSFDFEEDPDFPNVFKFHWKVRVSEVAKFLDEFDPLYEDLVGDPFNFSNVESRWDPCNTVIPSDKFLKGFVEYMEYLLKEFIRLTSDSKIKEFRAELGDNFIYTYKSDRDPLIKFISEVSL